MSLEAFFQAVEGVGLVVEIDVEVQAGQDGEVEADARREEGLVALEVVGDDVADPDAAVDQAADEQIRLRDDRLLGRASEAVLVVRDVDLEGEQPDRVDLVGEEPGVPLVVDVEVGVVEVVKRRPVVDPEADLVVGGSGRRRQERRDDRRERGGTG